MALCDEASLSMRKSTLQHPDSGQKPDVLTYMYVDVLKGDRLKLPAGWFSEC